MNMDKKQDKMDNKEKEFLKYKVIIEKLQKDIDIMKKNADEIFLNSPLYKDMSKEIEDLKAKNNQLEKQVKNEISMGHNERGAGRKERLSDQDKELIKMYRIQGFTIKKIAEMFKCSSGLVSKTLSEGKRKDDV